MSSLLTPPESAETVSVAAAPPASAALQPELPPPSALERFAQRATAFAETWMPDAFVFALAATCMVILGAFLVDPTVRAQPMTVVDAWGKGFWILIPFTLQMSMIIIGGYVLASSPPVFRLIVRLASLPRSAKGAVWLVAVAAMLRAC